MRALTTCSLALLFASAAEAQPEYRWPTAEGLWITAHMAHWQGAAYVDYLCGSRTYDGHRGTDIGVVYSPVYSAADGEVSYRLDGYGEGYWGSTAGSGFGNHVIVHHGSGEETLYAHLLAYSGLPNLGTVLSCSDVVATSGNSGNSTGPHLHFEVRRGATQGVWYSGYADDPFAGACGGPVSLWTEQNAGSPLADCGDGTYVPPSGFCVGLANGDWCDGSDLVTCSNDYEIGRTTCGSGCISMPFGTPDECASSGFCSGLLDGLWCDGSDLVTCGSGSEVDRSTCAHGCESMPLGTPDQCAQPTGFCQGLQGGYWCDGDDLVYCSSGVETSRETCGAGCLSMPLGTPDTCAAGPSLVAGGTCPGTGSLSISGLTPGGTYALISGSGPGSATIPSGSCAGAQTGLTGLALRHTGVADGSGSDALAPSLSGSACGVRLQALDLATCTLSSVVPLP